MFSVNRIYLFIYLFITSARLRITRDFFFRNLTLSMRHQYIYISIQRAINIV